MEWHATANLPLLRVGPDIGNGNLICPPALVVLHKWGLGIRHCKHSCVTLKYSCRHPFVLILKASLSSGVRNPYRLGDSKVENTQMAT